MVTRKRKYESGTPPLVAVPLAWADAGPFGLKSRSWTRLKILTICLTDPSLPVKRSNPSLTIDGRVVRILADNEITASMMDNDPKDWEWENESEQV